MAKLETCERELFFDTSEHTGVFYVDLAQCLSLVNRRGAYRQGCQYVFKLEIFGDEAATAVCSVATLPESWVAVNAWEKFFHAWNDQQIDMARESGTLSTGAKYRDFKIFMDNLHANATVASNLIPFGYSVAAPATGAYAWNASEIVVPNAGAPGNTAEYFLHMLGPDNGAASRAMIMGYAQSRARPMGVEDPNIVDQPSGGILGQITDVGDNTSQVIDNFQESNNETPYIIDVDTVDEFYPGGVNQAPTVGSFVRDVLSVRNGTGSANSDQTGWISANCGLIQLAMANCDAIKITIAPGPVAGVMSRPMQVVN